MKKPGDLSERNAEWLIGGMGRLGCWGFGQAKFGELFGKS
jgi:hypothetical protein